LGATSTIHKLCAAKEKYTYPKKFRVAYAKNSDEKVFEINRILNDSGMSKGATISVQSCNKETLDAIKRKNITMDVFKKLLSLYNKNNIPTYTELIVGLPLETYETFTNGINSVLANCQHDSLNIYTCDILPNTAIEKELDKYEITTIKTPIFLQHATPGKQEIEEYNNFISSTKSMSKSAMHKTLLFSYVIQALHCMGLTQYIAIYFFIEKGKSYKEFYEELINFFIHNPKTFIAKNLKLFSEIITKGLNGSTWGYYSDKFYDIWWPLEEGLFLNMVANKDLFYKEIAHYLEGDALLEEVIQYNNFCIFSPELEKSVDAISNYNFTEYFDKAKIGETIKLRSKKYYLKTCNDKYFKNELKEYSKEIVWYGRKGGMLFSKIKYSAISL
jgi:putative methyltransferase